jgi:hypothetical protein
MIKGFDHHHTRAFTHNEAVAFFIPRATRFLRFIIAS